MTPLVLSAVMLLGQEGSVAGRHWRDVQVLSAGSAIKLVMNGGDVEGTFVAANADELVIHLKRGNFSVDRANVERLDQKLPESNRGRNVGRGAGIGLFVGLLRSKFACGRCAVPGGALITAQSVLLGTVVGATASAANWETVYRR